jgi:acetyltransferase-like isoleucine patch superfamily enzyme
MAISSLRELFRQIVRRPRGVSIGRGSGVMRPWTVVNPERMSIGSGTSVLGNLYWECAKSAGPGGSQGRITVGSNVLIGSHSFFTSLREISIGDGCVLSGHIYISDENHGFNPKAGPILEQPLESKGPVRIGNNCFLGYRVAILPGVTLGEHCVVGANSTVTRSFPAYCMLAGSPARIIKQYSHEFGGWIKYDGRMPN